MYGTDQQILLISSSRAKGGPYLEPVRQHVVKFLGPGPKHIGFFGNAIVRKSHEEYKDMVAAAFEDLGYTFEVVHGGNAAYEFSKCDCVMVGGGNTFKLLSELYTTGMFDPLYDVVMSGKPYVGWSAGAVVAGASLCTTNDMPIIQPQTFLALRYFGFQVNPHYKNIETPGFHGETRDQRLEEFCNFNPTIPVVALPEGSALRLQKETLWYEGDEDGWIFEGIKHKPCTRQRITPGQDVSFLL